MKQEKGKENILLQYIAIFILPIILFVVVYKQGWQRDTRFLQLCMQLCIAILIGMTFYWSYQKREYEKSLLFLIIAIGIVMRIGYMLYTPAGVRSHDFGDWSVGGNSGHANYIAFLLEKGTLPDSNTYQFYHPPLFHMLSAYIIKMMSFLNGVENYNAIEATKIISCYASCGTLLVVKSLCKEIGLKQKATFISVAIIAFLPNFYLLAGRINNDSLVIFFMMLVLLYSIRWYYSKKRKDIILLAIFMGLGIMTKTSCGILAIFTGMIMLYVLYKSWKEKQWKEIFLQLLIFAAICFPLALWYPIRNYLLFGQALMYVHPISDMNLYCGDYGVVERFLTLTPTALLGRLYNQPFEDYNVPVYLLKSALFGEFSFDINKFIPSALVIFNAILAIVAFLAMVYKIFFSKERSKYKLWLGMAFLWSVLVGFYLIFNIKEPFGCTMDFRYIVPTVVVGAVFLGQFTEELQKRNDKLKRICVKCIEILICLYAVFSVVMFCNIVS